MKLMQLFTLILLLLFLVNIGCTGDMKAKLGSDGAPVQLCTAKNKTSINLKSSATELLSPFLKTNSKIIGADFFTLKKGSAAGTFKINSDRPTELEEVVLDSGFPLVVLVNRQCVGESERTFVKAIQKSVRPFLKNDKTSPEQSITYKLPSKMTLQQVSEFLDQEPCVVGASPERKLEALSLPNDPKYSEQNALSSINHAQAWPKISGLNEDVVVAVVDSGTDLNHPDLLPTTWTNSREIPGNSVDDDNNGYVDDVHGYNICYLNGNIQGTWQTEHGEHIHGIIAGAANNNEGIVGVASPTVKVMHVFIFGWASGIGGTCNTMAPGETSRLEEGIRYAADNGAKVINLSWGARGYSSTTLSAVQYAIDKGAVVVAAAANSAEEITDANPWYPAVYAKDLKGLISVAATDANPSSSYVKCAFSNVSNSYVEIAAPGCDTSVTNSTYGVSGMLSTLRMSTHQGYGYMAGTSMATPHIVGAAGLVFAQRWSKGTRPTPAQVEDLLMAGSRTQSNLVDYVVGGRHLDLNLLMASLAGDEISPECP